MLLAALPLLVRGQASEEADTGVEVSADTTVQRDGRVVLTNWPSSLSGLLEEMGKKAPYLLPKIDSLSLDYRYVANDSTSTWSFVLEWRPGNRVLHEGKIMPRARAPSNIRMANIEFRAHVQTDGRPVGDMIVGVDSMRLGPSPSMYAFEVTVDHDRVLLNASEEAARKALLEGITIDRLVVERMGFVADTVATSDRPERPPEPDSRRDDAPPRISIPGTDIVIAGGGRSRPEADPDREEADDDSRSGSPRGDGMGRQRDDGDADEEWNRREGSSEDDEEDEEDENEMNLRMLALGAVASVGLLAYAGGTIGLYGRGDTPIGLAAGYTHPRGGIQLQASVNGAVLDGASGQKMTMKTMGFYDVFSSRVQPAMGLGLQLDATHERDIVPAVSLGVAANFHRFVILGGVDVIQKTPEVGITYNFRHNR